jgi:hypothetical protein
MPENLGGVRWEPDGIFAHHSHITKTKLLKLLYLFDVEFYRANGKTCPHCMQQPYQMCNSRLYKSCIINVEEWQSG